MTKDKKPEANIEKWGNVRYIVIRNSNGRIKSRRKWTKDFTLNKAKSKFNKERTLKEGSRKYDLENVTEIEDYSDSPKVSRKATVVQYLIVGYYIKRTGGKIQRVETSARSPQVEADQIRSGEVTVETLKDIAEVYFFKRVSEARNSDHYDKDKGKEIFEDGDAVIERQGLVYYESKV